jgi:ribonuclease-3
MPRDLAALEQKLGLTFINRKLLLQAVTHRSFLNENRQWPVGHNERLEFLGDAVLEFVVTRFLYECFPDENEGKLTAYRSALVNTKTLLSIAITLGINDFILLSRGESKDIGRARQHLLACTFEAIVGAVYLDQGNEAAKRFIAEHIFPLIEDIVAKQLWRSPKSWLQEEGQARVHITPRYKLITQSGPDHNKQFVIGVFFGNEKVAEGSGASKQEAEDEAARNALIAKGWAGNTGSR